jgi:hypothetical protein
MERRDLIRWLVATAGLQSLEALGATDLLALGRDVHRHLPARPINPTIAIAAERILPGATTANVGAFIDKMLTDWHTPDERDRILAGLRELDSQGNFVDKSEPDQIAILTALDESHADWFARLKYLTVYGYCTSEVGMRELKLWPQPWRYDPCAPL